jgi:hypothetical protein
MPESGVIIYPVYINAFNYLKFIASKSKFLLGLRVKKPKAVCLNIFLVKKR